jgi:hypothetical protein
MQKNAQCDFRKLKATKKWGICFGPSLTKKNVWESTWAFTYNEKCIEVGLAFDDGGKFLG